MKLKAITLVAIIVCSLFALSCLHSVAAVPTISVGFYKNNGYGMGNDINGEWTLNTEVSADVRRVEFFFDGRLVLNDTTSPFSWNFNTANYTAGLHLMSATAYNAAGEFATAEVTRNFVPFPLDFVVGIFALIIVTMVIVLIGALIRAKKLGVKLKKNPPKPQP
jgi:hypothetical protein